MSKIALSSYVIPSLSSDETLYALMGEDSLKPQFDKTVSFSEIENAIGELALDDEDEESITIAQAIKLYFDTIMPERSANPDDPIWENVGRLSRYTSKDKSLVTNFSSGGIYIDEEGKLIFCHGKIGEDNSYTVPLVFQGSCWSIPGTKFTSQALVTEENKRQDGTTSKVYFLEGIVMDEAENPHQIRIWVNVGLKDAEERKADKGNIKAANLFSKKFYSKKSTDFSDCVQTQKSGGFGWKSDWSIFLKAYIAAGLKEACFAITHVVKEVKTKKEDGSIFPVYSVVLDAERLPEDVRIEVMDFSRPLPAGGGYYTLWMNFRDLGLLQIPTKSAQSSIATSFKQFVADPANAHLVSGSDEKTVIDLTANPWLLQLKPPTKAGAKNPGYSLWTKGDTEASPSRARMLLQATGSIALFGGVSLDSIVTELPKPVAFEATAPTSFNDDDEDDVSFSDEDED